MCGGGGGGRGQAGRGGAGPASEPGGWMEQELTSHWAQETKRLRATRRSPLRVTLTGAAVGKEQMTFLIKICFY